MVSTELIARALVVIADRIAGSRDELNRLDANSGDGDLGVTMAMAASAVKETAGGAEPELGGLLHSCGTEIARKAPSTCGTLVATGFLAAARSADAPASTPLELLARLTEAAEGAITERGRAAYGDRTLLDALGPAVDALRSAAAQGVSVEEGLRLAALAARAGSRKTAEMEPRAGRARWMPERSRGHEDGGAAFIALALDAAWRAVAPVSSEPG